MNEFIEPSFFETIVELLLLLVGMFCICSAMYFLGRLDENKTVMSQRRRQERMKSLNKILNEIGVEDVEREECRN